jgi:hypothetical protein
LELIRANLTLNNPIASDRRGTHVNRPKKLPPQIRLEIQQHIDSFPKYTSHYARQAGNPVREYLHEDLNVSRMFRLFVAKHPNNLRIPHLKWAYSNAILRKGLKFGLPRADTCKVCDKFFVQLSSASSLIAKQQIQSLTDSHHQDAKSGYENIQNDVNQSKLNNDMVVLCVDLEQVKFNYLLFDFDDCNNT